jgi:hypothetical protein
MEGSETWNVISEIGRGVQTNSHSVAVSEDS